MSYLRQRYILIFNLWPDKYNCYVNAACCCVVPIFDTCTLSNSLSATKELLCFEGEKTRSVSLTEFSSVRQYKY
jgi:hypothetical protein